MSVRNLWTSKECALLFKVFEEKRILQIIDAKKIRPNEIFQIVHTEFLRHGFEEKSPLQIQTKWKNLKKGYLSARKANGGLGSKACDYFEELDCLLGSRPLPTKPDPLGIDLNAGTTECFSTEPFIVYEGEVEENTASPTLPEPQADYKRKRLNNSVDNFTMKLRKINSDMQRELIRNQKKLIDYEFGLYSKKEDELMEKFHRQNRKTIDDANKSFLYEMKKILANDDSCTEQRCTHRQQAPIKRNTSIDEGKYVVFSPQNEDDYDDD